MPEIHFLYMHGCQIFLKIQNPGAIAWPQKEKIGCHMYQIIQRKPPEEQGFDAILNLSKKKYWCHFFYHPHILVATQHTIFKKLKKHCRESIDESVASTFHIHCFEKALPRVVQGGGTSRNSSAWIGRRWMNIFDCHVFKSKLHNRLSEHLTAYAGIYSQKFFTLETFPFDKVYSEWHEDQKRQPNCWGLFCLLIAF
jgi:hypothetical protein